MALIKCPECEKEISDQANICPHCGNPLKENQKNKTFDIKTIDKRLLYLLCAIFIIILTVIFLNKPFNTLSGADAQVFEYAKEVRDNTANNDNFTLDVVWCYCKDSTIHYVIQYTTTGTYGTPNVSLIEYSINKDGKESVDDFRRTNSLSAQLRDIIINSIKVDYLTLVEENKQITFEELNDHKDGYISIDVDSINELLQK